MLELKGVPASAGIAVGPLYLFKKQKITSYTEVSLLSPEQEIQRFEQAVEQAKRELDIK